MNRATSALILIEMAGLGLICGCRETAPPPRVPVPTQSDRYGAGRDADEMRPLPPYSYSDASMQPPYDDVPLITQRPPEQRAFVEAYQRVGSPRLALVVSGQDDVAAVSIDYDAVETIMSDWLAANGQVTLIAPTVARRRITDAQSRTNLAQQLGADVVVYVRAAATPSSPEGKDLRLVAQAINAQGGESIGRAVVDMPPPLEKGQINDYTRFLARKLMDDMTQTWQTTPRPQQNARPMTPAPAAPPATGPSARDAQSHEFPN